MGRYPDAAKKYGINDSSMSRQLPTVILFKGGKEVTRRPAADDRGKLIKFFFTEVNYPENPTNCHLTVCVRHECLYLNLNLVNVLDKTTKQTVSYRIVVYLLYIEHYYILDIYLWFI